jgi:drug/metabolite transporter (DMT)-like permease
MTKYAFEMGISLSNMMLIKCVVSSSLAVAVMRGRGHGPIKDFPREFWVPQLYRSILSNLVFIGGMIGTMLLPLTTMFVLYNTNPFFSSIFGLLVNKEPVLKSEILAMVICFSCVILISVQREEQSI